MSFHNSAEDIHLDGTILKANLFNAEGELQEAELDLNDVLGNDNGSFDWSGGGFADSADNLELAMEGDDNVPVLRATLRDAEGEDCDANVNLAERIHNNNGAFHFE